MRPSHLPVQSAPGSWAKNGIQLVLKEHESQTQHNLEWQPGGCQKYLFHVIIYTSAKTFF